jgi:uncharacterized membrane protein YagU involved in acid resistance
MNAVTSVIYDRQDPAARSREEDARGGKIASEVAAQKTAHLLGRNLDDQSARKWGSAVHQGLAIGAGAAYGVLRGRVPRLSVGVGLLFGLAFFVVADELGLVALRIAPGPRALPWQTHARGLAGHLTYGLATETQLRLLEGATRL